MAGLRGLTGPRFQRLFGGLLCAVDIANDPVTVYEHLVSFDPPEIDFLLPHGTWERPPPQRVEGDRRLDHRDLRPLARGADPETRVRLFESIILLLLGGPSGSEVIARARLIW